MNGLRWLVLLCCVAFALRSLSLIDATGLWSDELYTVGKSFQSSFAALLAMLRQDTHPPLYYALVWMWGQVITPTAVNLRLLSWLFYLAGGLMITLQAGTLALQRPRLAMALAALMTYCSPYPVRFSIEGKGYALLVFLVAVAWWFRHRQQPWCYGGAVALASLTHYYGLFLFAAALVWDSLRGRRGLSLSAAVGLLPSALWMYLASAYLLRSGTGAWIEPPEFALLEDTLARALGFWPLPKLALLLFIGWAILHWCSAPSSAPYTRPQSLEMMKGLADRSGLLPSIAMIIGVVLISYWRPIAFSRYFVVFLPAFIPWLAVQGASLSLTRLGQKVAGLVLVLLLLSWWWHAFAELDPGVRHLGSREGDQFQLISRFLAGQPYRFSRRERLFNLSDRMEVEAGRINSPSSVWGDASALEQLLSQSSPPHMIWLADSGDLEGVLPRMQPMLRRVNAQGYRCVKIFPNLTYAQIWRCERPTPSVAHQP
jgi:hypothetical protein